MPAAMKRKASMGGPHGEDEGAAYSGFGDFPKAMAKALSAAHLLLNHRSSVSSGYPSSSKVIGIGAAKIGEALILLNHKIEGDSRRGQIW